MVRSGGGVWVGGAGRGGCGGDWVVARPPKWKVARRDWRGKGKGGRGTVPGMWEGEGEEGGMRGRTGMKPVTDYSRKGKGPAGPTKPGFTPRPLAQAS